VGRQRVIVIAVNGCALVSALLFWLVGHQVAFAVLLCVSVLLGIALNFVGEDRRESWRDWLPPRRMYLLPLLLGGVGLTVARAVPGHTNPIIGRGLAMFGLSGGLTLAIWFKRTMNQH
jgi:MFS family permease